MPDRNLMQGWRPGLSGSSPAAVLEQILEARSAVLDAVRAVELIDLHGRDYVGREDSLSDDHRQRADILLQLDDLGDRLYAAAEAVAKHR